MSAEEKLLCQRCGRVLQFDGAIEAALPFGVCAVCFPVWHKKNCVLADRLAYLERVEKFFQMKHDYEYPNGECSADCLKCLEEDTLASKPAAIKPCCLCPDNHYPECPRASKPASKP